MERANKHLILAKIESVYGTDPTPAVASNAIITRGMPQFEPVAQQRSREVSLGYFGELAPINVGEAWKISFSTELKGSGSAGTASRYGCLFRACNMTEAISAGVSVSYTPNSTFLGESVTLYFYRGLVLHKMVGCVGNWKTTLKAGEIMVVDWEFTGLYAGPSDASDVAFPSPTHESVSPAIWDDANVVINSIDTLVLEEMMLDLGNVVSKRPDANSTYKGVGRYFISNRMSKGSMNPEVEALSTFNPWSLFDATTLFNLETKPTGSAGNIVEIVVTGANLEAPKYGERENINAYDLPFRIDPSITAGNNSIVLTFK